MRRVKIKKRFALFANLKLESINEREDRCYTPKHGSWLNIAECELSAMTRQCFKNKRFSDIEELRKNIQAWADKTNEKQRGVDWQFTVNDARNKLKSIYPKIKG